MQRVAHVTDRNRTPFHTDSSLPDSSGWSVVGLGLYFTRASLTDARLLAGQLNAAYQLGYADRLEDSLEKSVDLTKNP